MATKPTRPPLVLIVDDFPDAREMLGDYLIHAGFAVVEAENGEQAITRAQADAPAVILMDLSMPVMDGWEATRRLKQNPRTRTIPIIALTGHALSGEHEHARQVGCDSFITRPCPPATVVAEVKRMLQRRDSRNGRHGSQAT